MELQLPWSCSHGGVAATVELQEKKRIQAYGSYYRPNFTFDRREEKGHESDEMKYEYFGLSE